MTKYNARNVRVEVDGKPIHLAPPVLREPLFVRYRRMKRIDSALMVVTLMLFTAGVLTWNIDFTLTGLALEFVRILISGRRERLVR